MHSDPNRSGPILLEEAEANGCRRLVVGLGPGAELSHLVADGTTQPLASDINWVAGDTLPNLIVVKLAPTVRSRSAA